MDNFDLKKYLAEGKLNKKQPIQEMDAPYDIIQSTLKNLAGYWPVDIKNNLDRLGAEEFKKQLDDLKPYIDQYFKKDNEEPKEKSAFEKRLEKLAADEKARREQNLKEEEEEEDDEEDDDSYTTYCHLCDMPSTYSDDTPYGTCMCS